MKDLLILFFIGLGSCNSDKRRVKIESDTLDSKTSVLRSHCTFLETYDSAGPDRVNTKLSYDELITCVPILSQYIDKNDQIRLRVHNFVFNKIEYFELSTWKISPVLDTVFEIQVIRKKSDFDQVIVSRNRIRNKNNELIKLGDIRTTYDSSLSMFYFIKFEFEPFNVDQWQRVNGMHIGLKGIKISKQDTILSVQKKF